MAPRIPRVQSASDDSFQKLKTLKDFITSCFAALRRSSTSIADFSIRSYKAIKGAVLWIAHVPKAVVTTISRWISAIGRAFIYVGMTIKIVVLGAFRGIAIAAITYLSIALLYWIAVGLVKLYRIYQHKKRLRRQREYDEQRRRLLEQTDIRRRERAEEEYRRRLEREEEVRKNRERAEENERQNEALRQQTEAYERQHPFEDDQQRYRTWLRQCEALLACRETMTRFPDPPFWPCPKLECRNNGSLQACRHTVRRLYQASGVNLKDMLKKESRKWHPDKFERCPEQSRECIKAKAEEMFKIVQVLLSEC